MGGIIVVDFIDMAKPEHRQQLYDHMREIMANDRARHNILPLSKFGLMQITRQRVRPVLDIHVSEKCPSCLGKGEVQPSILFTDTLRENSSTSSKTSASATSLCTYTHTSTHTSKKASSPTYTANGAVLSDVLSRFFPTSRSHIYSTG